jgi:penicillin-binding protein 2
LWNEAPISRITVAEELSDHVVFDGLSLEAVAEIESHPTRYPGVHLRHLSRRIYPQGDLAAHAIGYLGRATAEEITAARQGESRNGDKPADDLIGRSGVERQYERLLRGQEGVSTDKLDAHGQLVESMIVRQPVPGQDVILSLDPALQRSAQSILDQAVARRLPSGDEQSDRASGGAILVLDVHDGAILAAASAPRYDPNGFAEGNRRAVNRWLDDPARPLLDRTIQMALPPGSVFKIISAAALLAAGVDPRLPVDCQGYLHQPDALRCAVFRRYGIGHGPVTLADALARSSNVYFFHHAEQSRAAPLVEWARRFELGRATGIDLPSEATGSLFSGSTSQIDPRLMAIGQGPLTATPVQVARIMAAIAGGGNLVTPHIAVLRDPQQHQVEALSAGMLDAIRKGLAQAVSDPEGTAHATVQSDQVAIAGKTGTAQAGGNQADHAWFAGYAPADHPNVAFVVVLEHAGNADLAAGPAARRLVERMSELDYFTVPDSRAAGGFTQRVMIK